MKILRALHLPLRPRRFARAGQNTALGLFVLAPVLVLTGCSGGSFSGIGGLPTPVPTVTSTPRPTATPAASAVISNAPIALGARQTGTLNASRVGNALSGTLVVGGLARVVSPRSASGFNFSLPPGSYPVSGTFDAPGGFSLSGTFPAPIGAFSFTGQLPTASSPGSYSLTAAGETQTGTIPALTVPTATPTAAPTTSPTVTATPTSGGGAAIHTSGGGTDSLLLSGSGTGANATYSATGYFGISQFQGGTNLSLQTNISNNSNPNVKDNATVGIYKSGLIHAGDSFSMVSTTSTTADHATLLFSFVPAGSDQGTLYYNTAGTLKITGVTATGFTYSLSNVKLASAGAVSGGPSAPITFASGSGTATYTP